MFLKRKNKLEFSPDEARRLLENEDMCRALYEIAWDKKESGKMHPRPCLSPTSGDDRLFYQARLRELLGIN